MARTRYRKTTERKEGYKRADEILEETPTAKLSALGERNEELESEYESGFHVDPRKLIELGDEYMKWFRKRPEGSVNQAFRLYRHAAEEATRSGDVEALNAVRDRCSAIAEEIPKLDEYNTEFGRSLMSGTVRKSREYAKSIGSIISENREMRARVEGGPVEFRRGAVPEGLSGARSRLKKKEREQAAAYARKKRKPKGIAGGVKEEIKEAAAKGRRYGGGTEPEESAARYMVETARVMREKKTKTSELDEKLESTSSLGTIDDVIGLADEYLKWSGKKPTQSVSKAVELYKRAMELAGHDQKLLSRIKARYTVLIRNASHTKDFSDEFFGAEVREAVDDARKYSKDIDSVIRYRRSEKPQMRAWKARFAAEQSAAEKPEPPMPPGEAAERRKERYEKARTEEKEKLRKRKRAGRAMEERRMYGKELSPEERKPKKGAKKK